MPLGWHSGRNGDTPGDDMNAQQGKVEETPTLSLDEHVQVLERELQLLQRATHRRNWIIEVLLVMILLMASTAWIVFRG